MYFIFDFDGTLVDSVNEMFTHFLNDQTLNPHKLTIPDLKKLKDVNSKEIFKSLNIPFYRVPKLLIKARQFMKTELPNLNSFVNLPQVIQALHNDKHILGILSSNSYDNISSWLEQQQIRQYFNFISAGSAYYGKKRKLQKIIKKYNIKKSEAFYVGDETRDIEAAKENGIYSISVTWGLHSEKNLMQCQPDFIVHNPSDLLQIKI